MANDLCPGQASLLEQLLLGKIPLLCGDMGKESRTSVPPIGPPIEGMKEPRERKRSFTFLGYGEKGLVFHLTHR